MRVVKRMCVLCVCVWVAERVCVCLACPPQRQPAVYVEDTHSEQHTSQWPARVDNLPAVEIGRAHV